MARSRTEINELPKEVNHVYSEGETKIETVTERVEQLPRGDEDTADYLFVIERIEGGNADNETPANIRFGYYHREPEVDEWTWGSQTTFNAPEYLTADLLADAVDNGILSLN